MAVGYTQSKLSAAVNRLDGVIEAKERVEAKVATLVQLSLVEEGGGYALDFLVNRGALLQFLDAEEKDAAERAHRLIHGVTGD